MMNPINNCLAKDETFLRVLLNSARQRPEMDEIVIRLEKFLERALRRDSTVSRDLSDYLREPEVGSRVANTAIDDALRFVSQQYDRLAEVKKIREFTQDEELLGRSILPGLLASIRELAGINKE